MSQNLSGKESIKAGFWYVFSNLLLKGISFITTPLFTRLLTKTDIGYYSNFSSWFNILLIVVTLDLSASIYLAVFDKKDSIDEYVSSILVLSSASTLLFYFVVLAFKAFFLSVFKVEDYTLHIMFLSLAVFPAITMYSTKCRVTGSFKTVVFLSLLSCALSTFFSLILVFHYRLGVAGRIYGTYVPQILLNFLVYLLILLKGKRVNPRVWKYALTLSLPLIFHDLAHIVLASSDRIMITQMLGTVDTASYSIAYACGSIVSLLFSSLNGAWSPWAYSCMDGNDSCILRRVVKPYTVFFIVIVFVGMFFAPELLWIMGGSAYMTALPLIPVVMVSYIYVFIYSFYVNIEFFYKKQKTIAIGTICAALLNLVLNYLFLPMYGYPAAAYTTLAGYVFLFLYNYLFVKHMKRDYYYQASFFIIILIVVSLAIPCMQLLYNLPTVRIMIAAISMGVLIMITILRRKDIILAVETRSITGIIEAYSLTSLKFKRKR